MLKEAALSLRSHRNFVTICACNCSSSMVRSFEQSRNTGRANVRPAGEESIDSLTLGQSWGAMRGLRCSLGDVVVCCVTLIGSTYDSLQPPQGLVSCASTAGMPLPSRSTRLYPGLCRGVASIFFCLPGSHDHEAFFGSRLDRLEDCCYASGRSTSDMRPRASRARRCSAFADL